jgi:hypothetical protein
MRLFVNPWNHIQLKSGNVGTSQLACTNSNRMSPNPGGLYFQSVSRCSSLLILPRQLPQLLLQALNLCYKPDESATRFSILFPPRGKESDTSSLCLDLVLLQLHPCPVRQLIRKRSHEENLRYGSRKCLVETDLLLLDAQCVFPGVEDVHEERPVLGQMLEVVWSSILTVR